jgi:hypothetical protein
MIRHHDIGKRIAQAVLLNPPELAHQQPANPPVLKMPHAFFRNRSQQINAPGLGMPALAQSLSMGFGNRHVDGLVIAAEAAPTAMKRM